jgi:hypothetical protein
MLVPKELETNLFRLRRAARIGQGLARQKFELEFLDMCAEPNGFDGLETMLRIRQEAVAKETRLRQAARSIGSYGGLIAPEGMVLALWSQTHRTVEGFNYDKGVWRPGWAAVLRTDDRTYPDGFIGSKSEQTPVRYLALTTRLISVDVDDESLARGLYAYSDVDDNNRYHITDPGYHVGLLPEPAEGRMFVRREVESAWTQSLFE